MRLGAELTGRVWNVEASSTAPAWNPPATTSQLPLACSIMDIETGDIIDLREGLASRSDDLIRWSGEAHGIVWSILLRGSASNTLEVTGHFYSENDRELVARIGIAPPGDDWIWHDDVIERHDLRDHPATRMQSPYGNTISPASPPNPIAVISRKQDVISIANHPDEPRLHQHAGATAPSFFGLVYRLGLTAQTDLFPHQATLHATLHAQSADSPTRAYRAAIAAFYQRHPAAYRNTLGPLGAWIPFAGSGTLPVGTPTSIALQLRPPGARPETPAPADAPRTFLSLDPWTQSVALRPHEPLTIATVHDRLTLLSSSGNGIASMLATAAGSGMFTGSDAEPHIAFENTHGSPNALIPVSTQPRLLPDPGHPISPAMALAAVVDSHLAADAWSGIAITDATARRTYTYRETAVASAEHPVHVEPITSQPYVTSDMDATAWLRAAHHRLQNAGRFLLVRHNIYVPTPASWMPLVDAWAFQVSAESFPAWEPLVGSTARRLRIMAGAKPVAAGLSADFSSLPDEIVDSFLRHCLLYGFLPGLLPDYREADIPTAQPAWSHRTLQLWHAHLPWLVRMAEAGWNPLPTTRCRQPDIQLESFGPRLGSSFHAIMNHHPRARTALIEFPAFRHDGLILHPISGRVDIRRAGITEPVSLPLDGAAITLLEAAPVANLPHLLTTLTPDEHSSDTHRALHDNLASLQQETKQGLWTDIEWPDPVIRGEPLQFNVRFDNRGEQTFRIAHVMAHGGRPARRAVEPGFPLAPGEQRTVTVRLRERDIEGDPFLRVTWDYEAAGRTNQGRRAMQPVYRNPLALHVDPPSLLAFDTEAEIAVHIENHAARQRELDVRSQIAGANTSFVQRAVWGADAERTMTLRIEGQPGETGRLDVAVLENGDVVSKARVPFAFLPEDANLLRDHRIQVTASSSAPGFHPNALRDGAKASDTLPGSNMSWQSRSHPESHRIELLFPRAIASRGMTLYWPTDALGTHVSRALIVEAHNEAGAWMHLEDIHPAPTDSVTRVQWTEQPLTAIRITQPPRQGSSRAPHAMWLAEIEIE